MNQDKVTYFIIRGNSWYPEVLYCGSPCRLRTIPADNDIRLGVRVIYRKTVLPSLRGISWASPSYNLSYRLTRRAQHPLDDKTTRFGFRAVYRKSYE